MKKLHFAAVAAVLSGACVAVAAADMTSMDADGDKMISKQEYMKNHEAMYDRMDKSGKGMMPAKDMEMAMQGESMRADKPKGDAMMKDDKAMKSDKK